MKLLWLGWKIYFWIILALLLVPYAIQGVGDVLEAVDLVVSFPSLVSLFAYAYRKRLVRATPWKIYAIVFVLFEVYYNITLIAEGQSTLADFLVGLAVLLPLHISLFLYAFRFMDSGKVTNMAETGQV